MQITWTILKAMFAETTFNISGKVTTHRLARLATEVMCVAIGLAIGAWIRFPLPFSPVPVTLQTFVVLIAPFFIARDRVAAGASLFALLGLLGMPIFASTGGAGFGYLLGFIIAPHVMHGFNNRVTGMMAGMSVIYALGVCWLAEWMHVGWGSAMCLGVVPFVPGDLAKIMLACAIMRKISPRI
jgi:biotin transport system substrate-specific component